MKVLIKDEVKDATYYVNRTTGDSILQADPVVVENVSQLSGLRLHPFGDEIKETHESLKPDGVGIIGELLTRTAEPAEEPTKKPVLSLEQIEVNVESKASAGDSDMVPQSGTYARCCILSNQRRSFSLGIGFHYRDLEAYIFANHRAEPSSLASRPLDLTTPEGFNCLVRHIVGNLSFSEEAAYGLDPTRFQNIFRINNRYYEIVRHLYVRSSLRFGGRSTVVYSLQGMYTCGF